ncbi:MAG: glycosyltransferase family 4 protein [bacterium]
MSSKIKVLQLGNPKGLYGAERWIVTLIRYLNPKKVESCVASIKDESHLDVPLCFVAEKFGFPTKTFECYGKLNFSAVTKLREFILKHRINILHTHGYKTDLLGLLSTKGTQCKIISTPHGWTKKPDLKLLFYEILDRSIFPFFDAVVPLSEDLYRTLSRFPGLRKKLYLIKNGVDTSEIEAEKYIANEISSLKAEGALVIGYIGRLIPGKGLDILLNAVANYAQPHWRIVIIGDGEQLSELRSMAQRLGICNQVKFLGFRSDRIAFLKGFDIFVLPSRSEGIPRCLMEAMAANVPVVASDVPGCRYLVDGKTTGLLFQTNQPKQLADSIKKLSFDSTLRANLSRNGRKLIYNQFSADRMAREYEKVFFHLV